MTEHDEQLDVEGPNESAPGHEIPDPPESPDPGEGTEDAEQPNESAPGHNPEPD